MDANLQVILQQLQADKGLDRAVLVEAIRSAIESAAKKSFNYAAEVVVDVDPETISFTVYEIRDVVDEVTDPAKEMSLEAARELNPDVKVGDRLKVATEPKDFGRIAAQTAKQVIIQKFKDAERDNVFEEFRGRQGEVVTGIVKRYTHGSLVVTINGAETTVPAKEQCPREHFKPGDRIRAYVKLVEKTARGPEIVLSRTSPELVKGLFDLEVPEIYDGTIEIRSIAREPGSRTKIAVWSNDPNVDPVGACVGMKGSRVRAVVEELNGEKIDIVRWSPDPVEFCAAALNPADILNITVDEEKGSILVLVPNDQLSLAIGKRGQNARLASRLIGWNIDIKSEADLYGPESETGQVEGVAGVGAGPAEESVPVSEPAEAPELPEGESAPSDEPSDEPVEAETPGDEPREAEPTDEAAEPEAAESEVTDEATRRV